MIKALIFGVIILQKKTLGDFHINPFDFHSFGMENDSPRTRLSLGDTKFSHNFQDFLYDKFKIVIDQDVIRRRSAVLDLAKNRRLFIEPKNGILDTIFFRAQMNYQQVSDYFARNKDPILLIGKATVFASLGIIIIKEIFAWYKKNGDYELLIDQADYEYHCNGYVSSHLGSNILTIINKASIKRDQLLQLVYQLEIAFSTPCFPISLLKYTEDISNKILILINNINSYIELNPILSGKDLEVISCLQYGVLILQSYQTEVSTRLIRNRILAAAKYCEDHVAYHKNVLKDRTQLLRFPFPTFIRLFIIRIGRRIRRHASHIVPNMIDSFRLRISRIRPLFDDFNPYPNSISNTSSEITNLHASVISTDKIVKEAEHIGISSVKKNGIILRGFEPPFSSPPQSLDPSEGMTAAQEAWEDFDTSVGQSSSLNVVEKIWLLEGILKGLYEAASTLQACLEKFTYTYQQIDGRRTDFSVPIMLNDQHWQMLQDHIQTATVIGVDCLRLLEVGVTDSTSTSTATGVGGSETAGRSDSHLSSFPSPSPTYSPTNCPTVHIPAIVEMQTDDLRSSTVHNKKSTADTCEHSQGVFCHSSMTDLIPTFTNRSAQPSDVVSIPTAPNHFEPTDIWEFCITTTCDLLELRSPWEIYSLNDCYTSAHIFNPSSQQLNINIDSVSRSHYHSDPIANATIHSAMKQFGNSTSHFIDHSSNKLQHIVLTTQNITYKHRVPGQLLIMPLTENSDIVVLIDTLEKDIADKPSVSANLYLSNNNLSCVPFSNNVSYVLLWEFANFDTDKNDKRRNIYTNTSDNNCEDCLNDLIKVLSTKTQTHVRTPHSSLRALIVATVLKETRRLARQSMRRFQPKSQSEGENRSTYIDRMPSPSPYKSPTSIKPISATPKNFSMESKPTAQSTTGPTRPTACPTACPTLPPTFWLTSDTSTAEYRKHEKSNGNIPESVRRLRELQKISNASNQVLQTYKRSTSGVNHLLDDSFKLRLEQLGFKENRNWVDRGRVISARVIGVLKVCLWSALWVGASLVDRRWDDVEATMAMVKLNLWDFADRRLVTPLRSITSDLIFNKRTAVSDRAALRDSQESLRNMLRDFLRQSKARPRLSPEEQSRVIQSLNMTPVSLQLEQEMRQPVPSILSGSMLKLVLLQLQFVKKEMLVAMGALDELFNANQVNMQLMAIIPAVLSLRTAWNVLQLLISGLKSPRRLRLRSSRVSVLSAVKAGIRGVARQVQLLVKVDRSNGVAPPAAATGGLLVSLYRIQNLLLLHSHLFKAEDMAALQEDLRDLADTNIDPTLRLFIADRIGRMGDRLTLRHGNLLFW